MPHTAPGCARPVLHFAQKGAVPVVLHFGSVGRGAHSRASPMGTYAPRPMWPRSSMSGRPLSGWGAGTVPVGDPGVDGLGGTVSVAPCFGRSAGRCGLCPSTAGVLARSVRGSRQRARRRRGWRTRPPARTPARLMAELRATTSAWPRRVSAACTPGCTRRQRSARQRFGLVKARPMQSRRVGQITSALSRGAADPLRYGGTRLAEQGGPGAR